MIGWDRYVGNTGARIGMHSFGASAPIGDLMKKFGFTAEKVLSAARGAARAGCGESCMNPLKQLEIEHRRMRENAGLAGAPSFADS